MTRVVSTGKESGNNFEPANGTGAQVRTALKDIFGALRTLNAGSGDPSGAANVATYQPHIDTNTNLLKISNASNNGFITLGNISQTNFGHADLTGATFTGPIINNYTSALRLPVGTTAQRPGSPAAGDIDLIQLQLKQKFIMVVYLQQLQEEQEQLVVETINGYLRTIKQLLKTMKSLLANTHTLCHQQLTIR